MSEREFEVAGRKFKLNKLDAFKQLHIVRRLGPILGEIVPVAQKIARMKKEKLSEEETMEQVAMIAAPIMNGLSKLSDEDANKVLLGLCSAAEMQQMPIGNWARVATDAGLMFQDLDLPTLLQIAGRAFQYNLAGFFASSPQAFRVGA